MITVLFWCWFCPSWLLTNSIIIGFIFYCHHPEQNPAPFHTACSQISCWNYLPTVSSQEGEVWWEQGVKQAWGARSVVKLLHTGDTKMHFKAKLELSISNCFSLTTAVCLLLAKLKPNLWTAASESCTIVRVNAHKSLCKFGTGTVFIQWFSIECTEFLVSGIF